MSITESHIQAPVERTLAPGEIKSLTIAGWTGRNAEAVEKHIRELEELGVPRPATTPIFYRVSASLATSSDNIEVLDTTSSGEVEPVVISLDGELWLGIGSDHTDRHAETFGVSLSKQMCPKPVGTALWRLRDLADRLDDLELRSYATRDGKRQLYQDGHLRSIRPIAELLELSGTGSAPPDGFAMFCGTIPVEGEIGFGSIFEMEIHDPATGKSLRSSYSVHALPNRG
ncbi:hypothetical protein AB7M35_002874 [Amorphus suaedae]